MVATIIHHNNKSLTKVEKYMATHIINVSFGLNHYVKTKTREKHSYHGINNIWSSANGEVEIKYWKH